MVKNKIIEEDIENIVKDLEELYKKLEGETVLITGGAGFLGKYLVLTLEYLNKNLLKNPCKIIILDNFIIGARDAFEENEYTKIIEQDISKPFKIEGEVNYIIHAASIAAPLFYNKYRLETIDVGFLGTKNMLELAKDKKVESFLFFSSSEVYGNPDSNNIPTKEDYYGNVSCIGARAAYDESKRIGETLCITYADMYNIPIKIVRPFNIFGPGMRLDDGRGVTNLVISALKGEKIPVYGDGKNTRTWCYVSDATVGFFKILLSNLNKEVFNVGSDEQEIQMRHLAEIVSGLVRKENVVIQNIEGPNEVYKKADPNRRCPDLVKIGTMLGYNSKINLINGLKRFITWAENEIKMQDYSSRYNNKCRICERADLKKVLSLGKTPLANNLLSDKDMSEESFPLEIDYCENCHLCQLSYIVNPEDLFKNYLYVSSTTDTFKKHFEEMAEKVRDDFSLNSSSLVIDIGSNDGFLLKKFKERGVRVVGVEPAENICDIARSEGIDTLNGFFNQDIVEDIIKMKGKADIVTANNVFAHIADIKKFTKDVKDLLKDNGVLIIEVQYILDTIQQLTFDNIYHEHLSYFSVMSLNEFFNRQDMQIFRVEHINTHGGSIRVYIQKSKGKHVKDQSVSHFLEKERKFGLDKFETYKKFAETIQEKKDEIREFLAEIKNKGKKIIGYGAPAKATTLLNFYKIDNKFIDYIVDDNPLKHGMIVPGVRIPIKNREYIDKNIPDYIMILAWNFADEIIKKNAAYSKNGAKFIIPAPELKVV